MRQDKHGTIAVDKTGKEACKKCAFRHVVPLGEACDHCLDNNKSDEYYINKEGI
jgi:hypothetical protein